MPKPAKPRTNDPATPAPFPVDPSFADQRSEFTSLPDNERSMTTLVSRDDVKLQLADLAELLTNATLTHPRAAGVLGDGLNRIAKLRSTLGL